MVSRGGTTLLLASVQCNLHETAPVVSPPDNLSSCVFHLASNARLSFCAVTTARLKQRRVVRLAPQANGWSLDSAVAAFMGTGDDVPAGPLAAASRGNISSSRSNISSAAASASLPPGGKRCNGGTCVSCIQTKRCVCLRLTPPVVCACQGGSVCR